MNGVHTVDLRIEGRPYNGTVDRPLQFFKEIRQRMCTSILPVLESCDHTRMLNSHNTIVRRVFIGSITFRHAPRNIMSVMSELDALKICAKIMLVEFDPV